MGEERTTSTSSSGAAQPPGGTAGRQEGRDDTADRDDAADRDDVDRDGRREPLGRAFRNVFTANLSSSLGDGIARVALPLLATRLTTDPVLISGIAVLSMLPWLFFALPAGILVDRMDRRRALALAAAVRTALALGVLALTATDTLTIAWLYVVVFLYGTFETLYDGAIRAIVPSVVRRADLPRANSRIEGAELVVQNFVSAPLTSTLFAVSVLLPLTGLAGAYALTIPLALLLPAVAAGRAPATAAAGPTADGAGWRRQLLDGLRFIRASRMLSTLWFLSTFSGIWMSAATATFVLYALDHLDIPEAWFGAFLLTGAVGGVVGAAVANRVKRAVGTGGGMAVANAATPAALLLMGAVPHVAVAGAAFAVLNGSIVVWNVLTVSLRQSIIPGRLLGRVHGTWRTLMWGCMPLGSLVGGLLAEVSLATPFLVAGALTAVTAAVYFRFLRGLPDPEDLDPDAT